MKSTMLPQVFYYRFKTNYVWLILTLLLLWSVLSLLDCVPKFIYWWEFWGMLGSCVYSLALWAFKYLKKHKMAVIDDKYIKIDHCRPLPWRLVACAEMKTAHCCFKKLPIIAIRTKKPIKYKFNPLQRLCAKSDFTAFSIALYALSEDDAKKITEIIAQKTILLG
ncbi:MAG: hypothetical protein E7004_04315 [Alphaproteobacteria bacterium]|nr:hypothetical protein [Alphaproteobacteria bacterium]